MASVEKQTGRRRSAVRLRLHELPDDINPTAVRELFSAYGEVGAVHIYSRPGDETVAHFELYEKPEVAGDYFFAGLRLRGKRLELEEGWNYGG